MIVAKPRPPQVDPLDILRPPPLPSSVLRDIKPKPRPKSKTTANRDQKIKKEPLFLSYIDDEAIESSADESDGSMNEDDKAFIDDGDIDPISRRNKSRPRPRIVKRSPIPTKRIIKKEDSIKLESSSDEMDGIESIPDEIADVKAQNEDKDGIKSEDDSMSGIESLDDVESVSAQLDELPRNEVAGGRPRRALVQTIVQTHTRVHDPQPSPDSDSDSDSDSNQDVVMLEDGGPDLSQTHAYKIRRDHPEPQPVQRQEDVHMGDGRPDDEEESDDEDDLDIMKYVRHPVQTVNHQAKAHTSNRSEREYSPLPAIPFDDVCGEEPDFEDGRDCELIKLSKLTDRLAIWYADAGRVDCQQPTTCSC
jgi:hypothetical protein